MSSHSLAPWDDVLAANWSRAAESIYLTDLRQFLPTAALAEKSLRGKWHVIPYEAGGRTGNLLWAFGDAQTPSVRRFESTRSRPR